MKVFRVSVNDCLKFEPGSSGVDTVGPGKSAQTEKHAYDLNISLSDYRRPYLKSLKKLELSVLGQQKFSNNRVYNFKHFSLGI